MKKIFVILSILMLGLCASAQQIEILPISVSKINAYGFDNTSNIIAKEIISADKNYNLNSSNQIPKLKSFVSDKNKAVNLKLVKNLSQNDKTLLIMSYVPDRNNKMFDLWDILKISTDFGINTNYAMEVKAVLTDNNDGVVLWQNTYNLPLSNFRAQNMTEAMDKKEKIVSYTRNIIVPDITQNIKLRLNPKEIDYASRVPKTEGTQEGIGLKYKNTIPIIKTRQMPDEDFEQRWRYDDSYSY